VVNVSNDAKVSDIFHKRPQKYKKIKIFLCH